MAVVVTRNLKHFPASWCAHFFAVAAQLMRRILVDHARHHNLKRGVGVQHVSLEESAIMGGNEDVDLPSLDDTMTTLARIDPRKVQVVEVRFFGGLSVEETAEGAQSIPRHGEARLEGAAKAWLYRELSGRTTYGLSTMETSRSAAADGSGPSGRKA